MCTCINTQATGVHSRPTNSEFQDIPYKKYIAWKNNFEVQSTKKYKEGWECFRTYSLMKKC